MSGGSGKMIPGKREEINLFKNTFLQHKPAEMLIFLKQGGQPRYATQVAKGVDCTYSHTVKVLDMFKDLGLVTFKKHGRIKVIHLTPEGDEIAHDMEGLVNKFRRLNKDMGLVPRNDPKKADAK